MLILASLTEKVLGAAFEVHRLLGPGLLESTYKACMLQELRLRGLCVEQEIVLPIAYKNVPVEAAYRADLVVEGKVLVELKAVEHLLPIHEAQVLTYLKHGNLPVGLLLNFNVRHLKSGIRRFVGPAAATHSAPQPGTSSRYWHD